MRPNVLFFGMQNAMSQAALAALLEKEIHVSGVVLGDQPSSSSQELFPPSDPRDISTWRELPQINRFVTSGVYETAVEKGIPTFPIGGDVRKVTDAVRELRPDIGCVACFPLRIPMDLIERFPLGILNLHPSLLPHHRGPYPLFWQFRNGRMDRYGVTIHLIDEDLDTGDIVLQQRILYEDGISGRQAETIAGKIGGTLLAKACKGLYENTLEPYPQFGAGSYEGTPTADDFLISSDWSAVRAFNFIRATDHWGFPYLVAGAPDSVELSGAVSYNPYGVMADKISRVGDVVYVRFNPGVLEARLR